MGASTVGVQVDGSPEFSFCTRPVPGKELGVSQCGVSFGQRFVKLQRFGGRRLGHGKSLARRRKGSSSTESDVGVSQAGVCQGITGVYVDGLLEVLDTPLIPLGRGLFLVLMP